MKAKIHSFESFGTVDGPGIRFVVFFQGCPLRCKYCHNPDTWKYDSDNEYTSDEIVSRIVRYKNYFGEKGGVTVSGGEPLCQIDFIIELFKKLKNEGINTAVDTSGYMFDENNEEVDLRQLEEEESKDGPILSIDEIKDDIKDIPVDDSFDEE